jgi:hypothetical protein
MYCGRRISVLRWWCLCLFGLEAVLGVANAPDVSVFPGRVNNPASVAPRLNLERRCGPLPRAIRYGRHGSVSDAACTGKGSASCYQQFSLSSHDGLHKIHPCGSSWLVVNLRSRKVTHAGRRLQSMVVVFYHQRYLTTLACHALHCTSTRYARR